ncbi:MAG: carbohydrate-binding protein CenC [Gammaproteobacteria bacterium]|nr:MAG: carbohydrate-binding protein CenC [Gammaproteobacteria bacterium]
MPMYAVRHSSLSLAVALALATAASLASAAKPQIDLEDHFEFDASLSAPYLANADHARDFGLQFRFPGANDGTMIVWRVDVLDNAGAAVRTWHGESKLAEGLGAAQINWSEFDPQNGPVPYGFYKARMQAYALDNYSERLGYGTLAQRVDSALRNNANEAVEQTFDIQVGTMTPPSMPAFAPLRTGAHLRANAMSVGATGGLPYTVYLGNLHSQTNHSDGGGPVSTCTGAQNPQSGVGGPAEAYQYALNEGLDILMTSEHNHMYDGSTGTNTSASPTTAHNLFQSGLSAATSFNSAHPGFLGVYGLEWGVITNGGHMNIFNTPSLLEWEYNSSNQLIGDVFTAKSDYGAMYTLMKANGWIGQFNHPATSAQFTVGGVDLAYTADGDQAMVLCEVMNSSAFSTSTTEAETTHTSYEAACNKFLEAGYHVAFSTDQDNHCAQWGASYTNRTGVLIPNGTALSTQSFIDALKARHVYATYDKTSQLILSTSGGHIMGDQFNNSGSLTLTVNYAPGAGKSASQVQLMEGVPGSNGTVTVASTTSVTTLTPTNGLHFYYAKVTQNDGGLLFSAPVWVNQGTGGGDTTPPTVSASESGTSGTITLSASASDNVGVSKVEFYIDGTLNATDTTSPYSTTVDSTTLANGSHNLVAKAYDAAGNVGTSTTVAFSVSNTTPDTTPPTVSASESGTSGTITLSASASDNVGVSKVEFYIDGTLNATDTTSPYSTTVNSTTLANGSHNLVAKAYDAAGNVGTSSTVAFSVSNTVTPTELIVNGGFESTASWTASTGVICATGCTGESAHGGSGFAWLDGYGAATTDTVSQNVTIPSTATSATFSFWLHVDTAETTTTTKYDTLTVQLQNSSGTVLTTLATYSNLDHNTGYAQKSFDVSAYKGQTVKVYFKGVEDASYQTSFVLDDVSLKSQ